MKPKFIIIFVVSVLALSFVIASTTKPARNATPPKAGPPSVTVALVEQKEIVEWDEFTGRIEPVESVDIRPRVSGYIQKVAFQSGQLVKKGEVLFEIDPRWHQAEFDRRQAELEQARVHFENAKREADRTAPLLANKAISAEESESREARHHEAKAAWHVAQAAFDSSKLDLDHTLVRSPINGRAGRALLTEGNYVSGTAGGASLLTTVVSVDPIYVHADVDENSLLKFNALAKANKLETDGSGRIPVELQLADEQDFPHKGYIESFNNHLDPATGTILLRAVFPSDGGRIVPGLFARVRVPLSERHPALLVEEQAIGTDQAQKFVLSLSSTNTVEYRAVTLGSVVEGKRIIRSGLNAGDTIVVNGLQRVRPGVMVNPQKATAKNESPTLARR